MWQVLVTLGGSKYFLKTILFMSLGRTHSLWKPSGPNLTSPPTPRSEEVELYFLMITTKINIKTSHQPPVTSTYQNFKLSRHVRLEVSIFAPIIQQRLVINIPFLNKVLRIDKRNVLTWRLVNFMSIPSNESSNEFSLMKFVILLTISLVEVSFSGPSLEQSNYNFYWFNYFSCLMIKETSRIYTNSGVVMISAKTWSSSWNIPTPVSGLCWGWPGGRCSRWWYSPP